ncbi:MAG: Integrase catalytic region [Herminiimonas sp.]|nr:Integrase catalytic region [Herminiimonas sp.]
MKQRPRIYYTQNQKALMWERWRKGDSLQQIAPLFDRNHSSVQRILAETGGIQPAQRSRSRLALTLTEAPDDPPIVPQWQRGRAKLTMTAAIERGRSCLVRSFRLTLCAFPRRRWQAFRLLQHVREQVGWHSLTEIITLHCVATVVSEEG